MWAVRAPCFWNRTKASEEPICQAERGKTIFLFEDTNYYKAEVDFLHFEVFLLNIEATKETEAFLFSTLETSGILMTESHIYKNSLAILGGSLEY